MARWSFHRKCVFLDAENEIYSHKRNCQAYSPQQLHEMIDLSLNQMGVDTLDMLTLEIPPFITESQLAIALYHIRVPFPPLSHLVRNILQSHPPSHHRQHLPLHRRRQRSLQVASHHRSQHPLLQFRHPASRPNFPPFLRRCSPTSVSSTVSSASRCPSISPSAFPRPDPSLPPSARFSPWNSARRRIRRYFWSDSETRSCCKA